MWFKFTNYYNLFQLRYNFYELSNLMKKCRKCVSHLPGIMLKKSSRSCFGWAAQLHHFPLKDQMWIHVRRDTKTWILEVHFAKLQFQDMYQIYLNFGDPNLLKESLGLISNQTPLLPYHTLWWYFHRITYTVTHRRGIIINSSWQPDDINYTHLKYRLSLM